MACSSEYEAMNSSLIQFPSVCEVAHARITCSNAVSTVHRNLRALFSSDRVTRIASIVIVAVAVFLLVAAVLLILNTIRMAMFARRREIEVMKLVGATNWFVRLPFMIEGMVCGVAGAVFASILLALSYQTLLADRVESSMTAGGGPTAIAFPLLVLLLILAGLGIGALGSGLTMRRFLQV